MMSTLLKLGLSGYDVKPRFGAFQCEYLQQNPLALRTLSYLPSPPPAHPVVFLDKHPNVQGVELLLDPVHYKKLCTFVQSLIIVRYM